MKRAIPILIFFVTGFISCKSEAPVYDLNTPMGVSGCFTTVSGENIIKLSFYGSNGVPSSSNPSFTERNFSGYNIYIDTAVNTWEAFQNIVSQHKTGKSWSSDLNVRKYIVSSSKTSEIYPSIPSYKLTSFTDFSLPVSAEISYTNNNGGTYSSTGIPINPLTTYYVGVTAVDMVNVNESYISDIATVNGVCP